MSDLRFLIQHVRGLRRSKYFSPYTSEFQEAVEALQVFKEKHDSEYTDKEGMLADSFFMKYYDCLPKKWNRFEEEEAE